MAEHPLFSADDRRQLAERGVTEAEAARQLGVLARPPGYARLDRPCTLGDGIECWDDARRAGYEAAAARAAAAGRLGGFVPASGAATRMFKELLAWRARPGLLPVEELEMAAAAGDKDAAVVQQWWSQLERFAFWPALRAAAGDGADRDAGPLRPWLDALLDTPGLGYAGLPKGLLDFHRTGDGVRTAVEGQLAAGAEILAVAGGTCPLHLTVSPEHREAFERCFADALPGLSAAAGRTFALSLSTQDPATDTLAGDPSAPDAAGGPFRADDGRLVFRPAGHGALIGNLARCDGDLVLLKNIDNVAVGLLGQATVHWARALFGRLLELTTVGHAHERAVAADEPGALAAARAWLTAEFGDETADETAEHILDESAAGTAVGTADERAAVLDALARPTRVCGMVPNTGEPGGGPFWVRGRDGRVSRQIVESAEVDPDDAHQQALLGRSTHFNPVFVVAALRDGTGAPYALERFVDPDAVITTRKSSGGRELLALERPGLWNGAMAYWHTAFVEVPTAVFNPVKTVLDLLRPAHQG